MRTTKACQAVASWICGGVAFSTAVEMVVPTPPVGVVVIVVVMTRPAALSVDETRTRKALVAASQHRPVLMRTAKACKAVASWICGGVAFSTAVEIVVPTPPVGVVVIVVVLGVDETRTRRALVAASQHYPVLMRTAKACKAVTSWICGGVAFSTAVEMVVPTPPVGVVVIVVVL